MDNKNELWYTQRTGWLYDLKTIICGMKGFYYGSF